MALMINLMILTTIFVLVWMIVDDHKNRTGKLTYIVVMSFLTWVLYPAYYFFNRKRYILEAKENPVEYSSNKKIVLYLAAFVYAALWFDALEHLSARGDCNGATTTEIIRGILLSPHELESIETLNDEYSGPDVTIPKYANVCVANVINSNGSVKKLIFASYFIDDRVVVNIID